MRSWIGEGISIKEFIGSLVFASVTVLNEMSCGKLKRIIAKPKLLGKEVGLWQSLRFLHWSSFTVCATQRVRIPSVRDCHG